MSVECVLLYRLPMRCRVKYCKKTVRKKRKRIRLQQNKTAPEILIIKKKIKLLSSISLICGAATAPIVVAARVSSWQLGFLRDSSGF